MRTASARVYVADTDAIVAMLLAAAAVEQFSPRMWPHHRALHQLSGALRTGSSLHAAARRWKFRPSADGGYVLAGLERTFLRLSGDGWLGRRAEPEPMYEMTPRLREWGNELRSLLPTRDRAAINKAAQRLRATLTTSSK